MKNILILGAGKSATVLIEYLLENASLNNWMITLGDIDADIAVQKLNKHPRGRGIYFDCADKEVREQSIREADIIISLLPAFLHIEIARDCVKFKKHFVCASYVSDEMKTLDAEARSAGIILMHEIGLDPGIDHMSAKKMIDAVQKAGGEVTAFESYTGGLIAPESDNNPWNYKFTWNPRNVVLAGQGTAKFLWDHQYKYIPYHKLFSRYDILEIPGYGEFEGYPNRDSLAYRKVYGLENTATIVRGTLRKRGFCDAWNVFVQLGMTDDSYTIEGIQNFSWKDFTNSFLPASSSRIQDKFFEYTGLHNSVAIQNKFEWLGLFSEEKIYREVDSPINVSPAQVLQKLLEEKWQLEEKDKDMCVMMHLMDYRLNGNTFSTQSSMIVIGEDGLHTAMAKTVGLPAAIVVKMILNGIIKNTGIVIPVLPEIYDPVLEELELEHGIKFEEITSMK